MGKKGPKVVKKGKKKRKPKKSSERWKKYKIDGGKAQPTAKFCPRCGPGIFLAESKNRWFCGRCHYTEFKSREQKEEKTEEKK
ncbi:MAG: 30S ribosomal protein S27ae [Candidatus Pacearchaeota archaeon]|nr:MAG: 30S ribosomal protein S27ae [Candidatus Pacearchaeota archaeon]